MNWNSFGIIGYLSVLLWVCVPLLWVLHRIKGNSSRWLCPIALLVALLAFAFAKVNSETHVNRIEPDRSEMVAEVQAREEAKRKAAEDSRGEDVADIRFAEDASGDFMDKAGMDESDLKYMDSVNKTSEPDWKKKKKGRSSGSSGDGDLESMLGGEKAIGGMESDSLKDEDKPEPIVMRESDMAMANKLDLTTTRYLILLALVMLAVDYLRRANRYAFASYPLPLPSSWLNGMMPIPPVVIRPEPARRNMDEELRWLARRGDTFVYVTDDRNEAAGIPSSLPRIGRKRRPVDVLNVAADGNEISDEFIFEALWYGRSCFVVDSTERAERMMVRFLKLLDERKKVRAHVSQTAHIVWDARQPLSEEKALTFERLAKTTGFSMLVSRDATYRQSIQI
jgi:hypothetical protein